MSGETRACNHKGTKRGTTLGIDMAAFQCPSCGQQRSRSRGHDCPVCWLIADFALEHRRGEHKDKPVHGCRACIPRLRAQLRRNAPKAVAPSDDASTRVEKPRDAISASKDTPVRTSSSHANCEHESTKAARSKCRAARRRAT